MNIFCDFKRLFTVNFSGISNFSKLAVDIRVFLEFYLSLASFLFPPFHLPNKREDHVTSEGEFMGVYLQLELFLTLRFTISSRFLKTDIRDLTLKGSLGYFCVVS